VPGLRLGTVTAAYLDWFRRTLAERSSPEGVPYFRHELVEIIRGLETGGMVMGCLLPPDAAVTLQSEVLPGLRALLASMPAPPPQAPRRTRPSRRLTPDQRGALARRPRVGELAPFGPVSSFAVGGLLAAGFAPGTEQLLVVSSNGKGVFDCASGRRVGRDAGDSAATGHDGYPDSTVGIPPIEGVRVPLDGLDGGEALPFTTGDGIAAGLDDDGGHTRVWLEWPDQVQLAGQFEEVRALGFSDSGRSFIVAEQHTLHLWSRR
jgi:hypothetical protein